MFGARLQNILISYQEKGVFSFSFNDNVCYVHSEVIQSEINRQKSRENIVENEILKVRQQAMRILSVSFVFYGPNSFEYAEELNEKIYFSKMKEKFMLNKLALIPDSSLISKVHEQINERWWDRADLTLQFYNNIEFVEVPGEIEEVIYDIKIGR